MRIRSGKSGLAFGMVLLAHLAVTVVYVPGRLENGVYIRPHFVPAVQGAPAPQPLRDLADALASPDPLGKLQGPPVRQLVPPSAGVLSR
jgi:hypothetical protein